MDGDEWVRSVHHSTLRPTDDVSDWDELEEALTELLVNVPYVRSPDLVPWAWAVIETRERLDRALGEEATPAQGTGAHPDEGPDLPGRRLQQKVARGPQALPAKGATAGGPPRARVRRPASRGPTTGSRTKRIENA